MLSFSGRGPHFFLSFFITISISISFIFSWCHSVGVRSALCCLKLSGFCIRTPLVFFALVPSDSRCDPDGIGDKQPRTKNATLVLQFGLGTNLPSLLHALPFPLARALALSRSGHALTLRFHTRLDDRVLARLGREQGVVSY